MRPVAVGRKNWLHIGSAEAGPKVAAILSVVESCRSLGMPVTDYLADILPGLGRQRVSVAEKASPRPLVRFSRPDVIWLDAYLSGNIADDKLGV